MNKEARGAAWSMHPVKDMMGETAGPLAEWLDAVGNAGRASRGPAAAGRAREGEERIATAART